MTDKPYPFGEEQDWRNVIRLLVQTYMKWQVRTVRLNELLNTVMALPPQTRATLTVAYITSTGEQITPRIFIPKTRRPDSEVILTDRSEILKSD